jgi:very-short-patch-repair endonuclease
MKAFLRTHAQELAQQGVERRPSVDGLWRRAPTEAELRLWRLLRDRRLNGLKFRRPVPIGPYIADFLCVSARLIVEADGSQHGERTRDERRDAYLADHGWAVLRFWNHDILRNRESIIDTILARAGLPW